MTGEDFVDLIYEMSPRPSETFYYVKWLGEDLGPENALEMIMTDLGLYAGYELKVYLRNFCILILACFFLLTSMQVSHFLLNNI